GSSLLPGIRLRILSGGSGFLLKLAPRHPLPFRPGLSEGSRLSAKAPHPLLPSPPGEGNPSRLREAQQEPEVQKEVARGEAAGQIASPGPQLCSTPPQAPPECWSARGRPDH